MHLYLKRAMRETWLGRRRYILAAQIEADPEDLAVIHAHDLTQTIAFQASLDHVEELERRADAAYQRQKKLSVFNPEHTSKILLANAGVVALAIRANLARHNTFRITIAELLAGAVIECPNLTELVETETIIARSFDNLRRIVDHARAFDQGQETVLVPDDENQDPPAPPSTWPDYGRR